MNQLQRGDDLQFNKVEICGVNTAKLKVLKESEKMELLKKARAGDKKAREELVIGNLRLVLSVIQRFSTYACPMIIGEVRRHLRDNNPVRVSRSLRDTAYHAMQVRERLMNELERDPTPEEIAKELGIDREEVVIALDAIVEPLSLNEPVYSDGGDTIYVMDQIGDRESEESWLDEILLRQAIEELNPREKKILFLRFMQGKTQMEVAGEIGISQAQVSRLEKGAIKKIKDKNKA